MPSSVTRALYGFILIAAVAASSPPLSAAAESAPDQSAPNQSAEDFYRANRTMTLIVYTTAGSTYDLYGRVLVRHMPRYIPGEPTIVAKNMIGAGGLLATRYLYSQAPRDGLTFGTIGRGLAFEPLLGGSKTVDFDPLKFLWLGSMNRESTLAVSWHTSQVKTAQDLFTKELMVAGTGAGADSQIIPNALNGLLGTKFKIIAGYDSVTNAALAMERGEIEGLGYWSWSALKSSKPTWAPEGKVNLLFQTSLKPHPELPNVPLVTSLARSDEERQALELIFARETLGRPFLAPPELPADRGKLLRDAFDRTMTDKAFLADAEKAKMEVELVTGEEVEALLRKVYATPEAIVERTREAMNRQ
ncbi:MAG TPA: hypothetical protein VGO34_11975 [Alphaproteobacteria bacterium]